MSETKYVISEELRDKLLRCSDYENVDDTVGLYRQAHEELRAAPSVEMPEQSGGVVTRVEPVQIGFFERTGEEEGDIDFRAFYEGMNDVPERWVAAYADKRFLADFMKEEPYRVPAPTVQPEARGVDLSRVIEKWRDERAKYPSLSQTHYVIASFLSDLAHLQQSPQGVNVPTVQFFFKESGEIIDGAECRLFVFCDGVWQDNFERCESQSATVDFDTFIRERADIGWRVTYRSTTNQGDKP